MYDRPIQIEIKTAETFDHIRGSVTDSQTLTINTWAMVVDGGDTVELIDKRELVTTSRRRYLVRYDERLAEHKSKSWSVTDQHDGEKISTKPGQVRVIGRKGQIEILL